MAMDHSAEVDARTQTVRRFTEKILIMREKDAMEFCRPIHHIQIIGTSSLVCLNGEYVDAEFLQLF